LNPKRCSWGQQRSPAFQQGDGRTLFNWDLNWNLVAPRLPCNTVGSLGALRPEPPRTYAFDMLFRMKRLSWVIAGVLCASAAAQQPSAQRPVSVGIVFDTSGSMGAKLRPSRQLVEQLIKTANPQDEFFLIQFNDRPVLTSAFTADTGKIQDGLVFIQSKGRSALWDAIHLALNEIKKGQNPRKALLVISDGGDNSSRYSEDEIKNLARRAGVPIYAVGIYEPVTARGRTAEELQGPAQLNEIAEQSGERDFAVETIEEVPAVVAQVDTGMRAPSKPLL
jgi:VWFA-related protein